MNIFSLYNNYSKEAAKVANFTPPTEALAKAGNTKEGGNMQEGKRQKQIAGLLNEEINTIFQKIGLSMIDGGMVSISSVKITPDLLEARFYLSFFQVKDVKAALKKIEDRHHDIKKELAAKVRHQLRNIPVLKFYQDDTLDHVFKMEELFKKISEEKPPTPKGE